MSEKPERYTLTVVEAKELPARILAALEECHAEHRRLTGQQLADRFGYRDDRKIRIVIESLIAQGHPIAASTHDPQGYYITDNAVDAKQYGKTMRSRIVKNLRRLLNYETAAARKLSGQMSLDAALIERTIHELER